MVHIVDDSQTGELFFSLDYATLFVSSHGFQKWDGFPIIDILISEFIELTPLQCDKDNHRKMELVQAKSPPSILESNFFAILEILTSIF